MNRGNREGEEILIRPFRIEDYDGLIRLWQSVDLPFKSRGRDQRHKILAEIQQPTALFYVGEADGKIVASILGSHDGRKGWINRLAVLPGYRQQGIARQLVERVEQELERLGIEIAACLIEEYNSGSMEFFEHLGYVRHTDIFYFSKRRHPGV
jgi:ribosomal protein S18 acetylase RimI-like enzyme